MLIGIDPCFVCVISHLLSLYQIRLLIPNPVD